MGEHVGIPLVVLMALTCMTAMYSEWHCSHVLAVWGAGVWRGAGPRVRRTWVWDVTMSDCGPVGFECRRQLCVWVDHVELGEVEGRKKKKRQKFG